jgi:hypothetical protein
MFCFRLWGRNVVSWVQKDASVCLRWFIKEDRRAPRIGTGHVSSTALKAWNVLLLLLPTSPANSYLLIRLVSVLPVIVDRSAP